MAQAALAFGRQCGWTVTESPDDDPRYVPESFDVVSLIELVEHLPEPLPLLQSARKWLRTGGVLLVTTPNAQSLNARLLKQEWSIIRPPEHCLIWTAVAARRALERVGLRVVRVRSHGFNPSQLLFRLRRNRREFTAAERNDAARALNTALTSSPGRTAFKNVLNGILSAMGLGDTLKIWAERGFPASG